MVQACKANQYRESIHAGTWYPGSEKELNKLVGGYLENARPGVHAEIYGLIAPHAGYVYSGAIAGSSYKTVMDHTYDLVVVIGPSHHHGFHGASVDLLLGRKTPLGKVDYDLDRARKLIRECKLVTFEEMAHSQEHSTEIQIPLLQVALKKFKTLEIVMGTQDLETCEILADGIYKAVVDKKVLVVASSDLSHYHSQSAAEKLDNRVIDAVRAYDPERLADRLSQDSCEACGGGPIITALLVAKKLGADTAEIIEYGTSGKTSGDYSQVVGYLAAVMYRKETEADTGKIGVELGFTEEEKVKLKEIAQKTIEAVVQGEDIPEFKGITTKLKQPFGVFVTITKDGDLRGCIGHIIADQPLHEICAEMAKAAALSDPRFNPVRADELPSLEIEISVLTPFEPVQDFKEIVIGRDGLIIRRGYYQGLLLPQVATDYGWTVEEFLKHTCNKAGLPGDAYLQKETEILKFSAQVF